MAIQPNNIYTLSALMSEYNFMKNRNGNRNILQTVLCNSDKIIQLNLEDAAALCNVSSSTFLRFLKDMGIASFTELKSTLRAERLQYKYKYVVHNDLYNLALQTDNGKQAFESRIDSYMKYFESLRNIDHEACAGLVNCLNKAHRVFFIDIRYSNARILLQNSLAYCGKAVYFSADFNDQLEYLKTADPDSVIIMNAHRPDRDIYLEKLMPVATASGALVALICTGRQNSLGSQCDIVISHENSSEEDLLVIADELLYLHLASMFDATYIH